MSPLQRLHEAGQSIWVDFLRRTFLTNGELSRLIREDAVSGITSNPTIFRRAVAESVDHEQPIQQLVERGSRDPREIFYRLALGDIRAAAEVLRPVYVQTRGREGIGHRLVGIPTTGPGVHPAQCVVVELSIVPANHVRRRPAGAAYLCDRPAAGRIADMLAVHVDLLTNMTPPRLTNRTARCAGAAPATLQPARTRRIP